MDPKDSGEDKCATPAPAASGWLRRPRTRETNRRRVRDECRFAIPWEPYGSPPSLVFSIRPDVVGRSEGIENFGSGFGGFALVANCGWMPATSMPLGACCLTGARCLSRSRSAGGDHLDNAGSPRDHAGLVSQDIEFAVGIASEAEDRDTGMLDQVAYPMGDVG